MLQKSTFLPPPSHRNRIYPLCKPQSTESTKAFCDCCFPETRLYILPIPTQYHLCSPRVANYCVLITKGPVRILHRAPRASHMKGVNSELACRPASQAQRTCSVPLWDRSADTQHRKEIAVSWVYWRHSEMLMPLNDCFFSFHRKLGGGRGRKGSSLFLQTPDKII